MKKKLFIIFASCLFTAFLVTGFVACSGGAAPVEPVVPGNTENTYDFKLVSANADSVTVSWKKDTKSYSDENHVSLWIVSTDKNETYDSASYDQKKFNLSTSPATLDCTLKNLSPDTEYTIYLLGYDFDSNYNYTKKVCEFSLTAKTAKKDYFSKVNVFAYDEYVSLDWYRATGFSPASKIVISKKTDKEEDFTKVVEVTDSSSYYSDRNFEFETKYTYKFEAFDEDENLLGSKTETVTTKAMPVPSEITSITATKYIDGWELSWAGKPGATKYVVGEFTSSSSTEPVRTWEVTEPSFFYSRDITKSTDVYIKIDVYNPKGNSGYCSDKHIDSSATASSVSVKVAKTESSQTSVKVTCSDINVKKAKVEYAVKDYGKEYFMCEYQESKELEVENLPFAAETKIYLYAKVTYNTPDGEEKTYETSSLATLKTKSFAAMEKPVVESIGRTSATISFTPLTETQLFGVAPEKVCYRVTAYKNGSNSSGLYKSSAAGSTDFITVNGLDIASNYQFTVFAYVSGSTVYGEESEKCEAVSTKAALSAPTVISVEENHANISATKTTLQVNISQIPEDEKEDIEYGFVYALTDSVYANFRGITAATEYTTGTFEQSVNAGNKVYVFAYAQEVGNDSSRVYSTKSVSKDLEDIDEYNMYGVIGTPLIDFKDVRTTTSSGYLFGFVNELKALNDLIRDGTISGTVQDSLSYVVKLSLNDAALKSSSLAVLFLKRTYNQTKYSSYTLGNGEAYFVANPGPDRTSFSLATFPLNVSAISTTSLPTGNLITMNYIYNNSVYMVVSETDENSIGFSYRY